MKDGRFANMILQDLEHMKALLKVYLHDHHKVK
jgi:hypothetical protein